jgi:hypothetical protein
VNFEVICMIMAWLTKNWRNKLIWNYGFWDGNMAGTSTTISWLSIVGLDWVFDMLLWSISLTFWLKGLSILDSVWELSPKEHFWKSTLQDSLVRQPLSHLSTIGLVWILDKLFIQMFYKFKTIKIRNKHSY